MSNPLYSFLAHKAYALRKASLLMTTHAGSGHPSSCLSAADLVAALFFYCMQYDPRDKDNPNNDRFILSKGHAAPVLYAVWHEVGAITEEELMTYRVSGSRLEGHPTRRFPWAEAATGSLGIGLSIGAGMSMAAKMDRYDFRTFVLLGDAEVTEGSIWEAAEIAAFYQLDNLIALLDVNRLGQSGQALHGHHLEQYAAKFEAFGWKTIIVDGHDMVAIVGALDKARAHEGSPTIIIAKTFKGHGVPLLENKEGHHGKPLTKEQLPEALAAMEAFFAQAAQYTGDYSWQPQLPKAVKQAPLPCVTADLKDPLYEIGTRMATREAYGHALEALGHVCQTVVSLDAEVKNSTFAELFAAKFPARFVQCFIAEQNMVGMGIGLDNRGKLPFISTFGAFFSRAYDQIRMAAIGQAHLRLVGSHAGVSIGQDGPSQMALEDIALMASIPDSVILYPCDAVSTHRLVSLMADYEGISYLRTTRGATPVIYPLHEEFTIGGCKVLRASEQDVACIVASGITVFEALAAYEELQKQGISASVIDLYSVKPLDADTLIRLGKQAGNRIITVEDHYLWGGIGKAVAYAVRNTDIMIQCLAVTHVPQSGKSEELLAAAGIDSAAIIAAIQG